MTSEDFKPILNPGTKVPPYGTIAAVLWTAGERYYMLIDNFRSISMLPAEMVEQIANENPDKVC